MFSFQLNCRYIIFMMILPNIHLSFMVMTPHLLRHVDDEGDVGCVLLRRHRQEPVPRPGVLGDDVHEGTAGPVGDRQQTRRHHLHDT